MAQMLQNPELMRQMADPANMQAMMQMRQAMGQLQGTGLMPPSCAPAPPAAARSS
jgi:ubiquilin